MAFNNDVISAQKILLPLLLLLLRLAASKASMPSIVAIKYSREEKCILRFLNLSTNPSSIRLVINSETTEPLSEICLAIFFSVIALVLMHFNNCISHLVSDKSLLSLLLLTVVVVLKLLLLKQLRLFNLTVLCPLHWNMIVQEIVSWHQ